MMYMNARDRFYLARRNLMLPYKDGENKSIMRVFHECHYGLQKSGNWKTNTSIKKKIIELRSIMCIDKIYGGSRDKRWLIRAQSLSFNDKCRLSILVDELEIWLDKATQEETKFPYKRKRKHNIYLNTINISELQSI